MAKAADLISTAYVLNGFKDISEPITGAESAYALARLNSMIDLWNSQRLFIYNIKEVIATTSGRPITIGTGLTFNTVRPTKLENGCFARISGLDYPIQIINNEQYNEIPVKALASTIPLTVFYDNASSGNILFYPYQTSATEYHLQVQDQLLAFPDLTTNIVLTQGYQSAIEYSLAEELAAGVREVSPLVAHKAMLGRKAIRKLNAADACPLLSMGENIGSPLGLFLAG